MNCFHALRYHIYLYSIFDTICSRQTLECEVNITWLCSFVHCIPQLLYLYFVFECQCNSSFAQFYLTTLYDVQWSLIISLWNNAYQYCWATFSIINIGVLVQCAKTCTLHEFRRTNILHILHSQSTFLLLAPLTHIAVSHHLLLFYVFTDIVHSLVFN